MNFSREFAMPSSSTFSLPPVARLLDRWLADAEVIVDPFARESTRGTLRNDIDPNVTCQHQMDAADFVEYLAGHKVRANAVLFDPPYSPRQISECYRGFGKAAPRLAVNGWRRRCEKRVVNSPKLAYVARQTLHRCAELKRWKR